MQRKLMHPIISLFLLSAFISPFLIKSYHDVFEHTHEEEHKHSTNTLSYCDDNVEYCAYSNLAYYPIDNITISNTTELGIDILFNKECFFDTSIYTSQELNSSKGRSPPIV